MVKVLQLRWLERRSHKAGVASSNLVETTEKRNNIRNGVPLPLQWYPITCRNSIVVSTVDFHSTDGGSIPPSDTMGKLLNNLNNQLKTEYKKDAEECIKVYNFLKENSDGKVWSSDWNALTKIRFVNKIRITQLNFIGLMVLNGIRYDKRREK